MYCTLNESPAADVLNALYADAAAQRAKHDQGSHKPRPDFENMTPLERFTHAKDAYMPIDRPFGNFLYSTIRASRPQCVVEFGTSFGISTIFQAAAVRDNGVGRIVTTEFIETKAAKAKQNLTEAGLVDLIDFRVGDAMQTLLEPLPAPVDYLFLDGEKSMYIDIVKLLEPFMKSGCLIASDNTDSPGAATYLDYMRDPANGYISTPMLTPGDHKGHSGHELSVRL